MHLNLKIQQKIQLFIIGASIIIYAIALGYISINARNKAYKDAIQNTDSYAQGVAKDVTAQLNANMEIVKTLSNAFLVYKDFPGDEWQDLFLKMYQNVLVQNPEIYNLWDSWELSKIDSSWQKSHGRIALECFRDNGVYKTNKDYRSIESETDIYDGIIKKRRIQSIWEPYFDQVVDNKSERYLMTTLNSPILINGEYIGIVAIDITLDHFQNIVEKISPYEGSYAFMVSNGGLFAGHPDKAMLGKNIKDLFPEECKSNDIIENILNGRQFSYITLNDIGHDLYVSYAPIFVGDTKTPWSIAISVPMKVILKEANRNFTISLFIGIVGILAVAFIISLVSKNITNALRKGIDFAKNVADGDLTATFDINQKDEVGDLANALNQMVLRLREIVESVNLSAENISAASFEMSSSSQQMSQGANQQASSAEEVSSSMQEMVSSIHQNNDNAQQTEKIVIKTSEGIKEGSASSEISMDAMKKIAEKITIVNDIAFQTNILALNAAVEAARAGEHGKGFAVVAAEVRKLAERSKVAADEIEQLSKDGVAISEKAGKQLQSIVPEMEKTVKLIQEISASSLEQNSGAEQVNNAVQQLNQVTQQNAASSEELATSSEELASQAEQLKENISFFKTGKRLKLNKNKSNTSNSKLYENRETSIKSEIKNSQTKSSGVDLQMYDDKKIDEDYESF